MNRRGFFKSVAIAVTGVYLQLAPERRSPFDQIMDAARDVVPEYVIIGYDMVSSFGFGVADTGLSLLGERGGLKIYFDPYSPGDTVLVGFKNPSSDWNDKGPPIGQFVHEDWGYFMRYRQ